MPFKGISKGGVNMKKFKAAISAVLIFSIMFVFTGCGSSNTSADSSSGKKEPVKVKIGYFGNTCEVPVYAAYEKGFFKEEGLDVELIKGDANSLKEALAAGKIDATDGLLMQWLKPIESGLNIKFTAGLHTGCIQVLSKPDSKIKSVKDLKGKVIGVPAIGGGPMILASRLLSGEGFDSQKDVTWKVYPNSELPLILEKGEVDAISLADPLAQMTVDSGKGKSIYNSASDSPFKDEYCCLVVVNGTLIEKHPDTAAAITRAYMKGANWSNEHKQEIAKIETEKKYVPGEESVNAKVLAAYNYKPSVDGGSDAVLNAAKEMKKIGILAKETEPEALLKVAFIKLKGVE